MTLPEIPFSHPLTSLIEDHLADNGLRANDCLKETPDEAIYRFCDSNGSTVVLRLYRQPDEMGGLKHWFCFEFGVGLVPQTDAAKMLHQVCIGLHTCFVPVRAAAMPYDESSEILILIIRADVDLISRPTIVPLLELASTVAFELRNSLGLHPVSKAAADGVN